jgi:hypothetical protein
VLKCVQLEITAKLTIDSLQQIEVECSSQTFAVAN